ncbi:MAG: helix-turn-helix domain-containing protein [Ardenticatenaceae bacterium]
MTPFGEYLKILRERAGLSQEALAEEAQISSAYVSQIETGRRNAPTPDVLRRMAPSLGVPYIVLLRQAGQLTEAELQTLLLRAIRLLYIQEPGHEQLVLLLREAIDRWRTMSSEEQRNALDAASADHVAELILPALLQRQTDLLFAELFPHDEGEYPLENV